MFARTKVSLLQSAGIVLALAAFITVVAVQVTRTIEERDATAYRSRLDEVLGRVDAEATTLAKGGLAEIPAYVENSQKSVLDALAAWSQQQHLPLVLLDGEGKVLLHPALPAG